MGNSPSRNDLNTANINNNNNNNINDSSSAVAAAASGDDPDPLPIQPLKLKNTHNNIISSPPSSNESCFTPSATSVSSVTSTLNNLNIKSTTTACTTPDKSLYSIKEKNGSFSSASTSESQPSPSTSPSSTNSNDLHFKLELDKPTSNPKPSKDALDVPIKQPPPSNKSSSSPQNVNIDTIIERLVASGLQKKNPKSFILSNSEIRFICAKARRIFMSQPMLLELAAPVKILGDIHGQFNDLLRIFKLCGFPPSSNYLFLGDYVDRGKQSLETMVLLLALKIKYPENFFLLRGNHESADITKMYGFYDECKRRNSNGVKMWKLFVDVFNTLPVAATIADKIFCVHGGLSPDLKDLNQIKKIQRPTDIPDEGLLADLLWSDPQDKDSPPSKSKSKKFSNDWKQNDRGVSYCFNENVVKNFGAKFDFDLIARGHMVVEEGYEFYANRRLVTIFSAPNYCGEFRNWGAVMNVNKKLMCSFELLKPKERRK